jgi:hypothetical protein
MHAVAPSSGAAPHPHAKDHARDNKQREARRVAKGARMQRGIDRLLTDANANDRQRTRQGEHRHQGDDGEQILSLARQHDRRVSRLDGVVVCPTGRDISGPR